MAAIDIGAECIDRGASYFSDVTFMGLDNPANASGVLTTVKIWALTNMSDVEVATFFEVSAAHYSTRDTEAIGTVTAGSCQEFAVNLDVEAGDYLGVYYSAGRIESIGSGFAGVYYKTGDNIPCTNASFTLYAGDAMSLYGEGETVVGAKTLVQAALISIPPLIVLPTLREILRLTGGC